MKLIPNVYILFYQRRYVDKVFSYSKHRKMRVYKKLYTACKSTE